MMRFFRIVFAKRPDHAAEVDRRIASASAHNERASNGLMDTIRELLAENDRIRAVPIRKHNVKIWP
ncbi:hypothetical protein [Ensifer sp. LCM 4579]|uniref:hypothetical protein n=1 Tax=Ensifer sp. LCM 4579 TaxID=1848292 RepID=UPI0008D9DEEA|nr:hypothetical protein [Ensifer sp. LCM 4579]OHV85821.1 hypothetical protein LCM4579_00170 [Ensifer sp. LCM 4579]